MRKQLIRRKLLLAFLAAGALYMPVMAEGTITSLVTVKDPNQTISDDIYVTNGATPSAVYIPQNMSGGEIHINSKNITVDRTGNDEGDYGLIDFDTGYKGKMNLADGLTMTGTFSGTKVRATGVTFDDVNEMSARNTGKPADGYISIGDRVTIDLKNQNENTDAKNPVTENYLRGLNVDGETVTAGDGLTINLAAHTGSDAEMEAINVAHYGSISIGDHARFTVENNTKGPLSHNLTDVVAFYLQHLKEQYVAPTGNCYFQLGKDAQIKGTYTSDEGLSDDQLTGQEFIGFRLENTTGSIGDSAKIVLDARGPARLIIGSSARNNSNVSFGTDIVHRISVDGYVNTLHGWDIGESSELAVGNSAVTEIQGNGSSNFIAGIENWDSSHAIFGDNTVTRISFNGSSGGIYGLFSVDSSYLQVGDNSCTEITANGSQTQNSTIRGIFNENGQMEIGDGAKLHIHAGITGDSKYSSFASGVQSDAGKLAVGDNLQVEMDTSGYQKTRGLYASGNGESLSVGDNLSAHINAESNGNGADVDAIGLLDLRSKVSIGNHSQILVNTSSGAFRAMGIYTLNKGTTNIGDDASVVVDSDAENNNHVLHAESGGTLTFAGSAYIQGNKEAAYAEGAGSRISLVGSGKKTVLGDLTSKNRGTILLDLATSDSLLRGTSSVLDASGNEDVSAADTELSLSHGARWQVTGSSSITKLVNNGGTVDMQYNPNYQTLHIGTFSGNNGTFKMKSDLASQTDGDKVTMDTAEPGSTGIISVYDKSLATGKEVTGARHLLMVTDNSKNATFLGESISTGGLWEIAPTIREGGTFADGDGNTVGTSGEWYLASVTRTINKDTKPLIEAGDNSYGLYRLSMDTLRQRLGDLRYRNRSDDKYDFWVRDRHSRFDGSGYDSKYNFFQIGVDTMPNEKSAYGFLVERGIGGPNFESGSGKNHTLAGALYATWIGDHGSYTDIVAKIGRNDTTLHTYGPYADRASYREDEKSLSVEYGKTLDIGSEGYFFEPQAQFVFGHLGSNSYTTRRGTNVHEDSFDSAIGRLGFVLGKKQKNGENPHDFYFKASVLHEFGGDRDYSLRRMNAYGDEERLDGSYNYRDTWYEVGFGGNVKINDNTFFYADVERSFGSDYTKKWQINAGINWSF